MALVGKPALVTDIGEIISRTQSRFGVFHARDAEKASGVRPVSCLKVRINVSLRSENRRARSSREGGAVRFDRNASCTC